MAVIVVDGEVWGSSGWVYRMVFRKVMPLLFDSEELRNEVGSARFRELFSRVERAVIYKSIDLGDFPTPFAAGLGLLIRNAAIELQAELATDKELTERHPGLVAMFKALEVLLINYAE